MHIRPLHSDLGVPIRVDWETTVAISRTTATVMHMVHPVSRKDGPLNGTAIKALKNLNAKYVRFLNWHAYPLLAIAELYPPTPEKTFWDFSAIDAEFIPFLEATKGMEPIVSFSAIPPWMFKHEGPVTYPDDADQPVLGASHSWELLDPSGEQVAEYFARIVSWYTQGGFIDENGTYHFSGFHFELPWWEVLNEADLHTPAQYARLSDAVIAAIRKVSPKTRFVGLSIYGGMPNGPDFFEYCLDPKNHRPDVQLDMMAYHFYAFPNANLSEYEPSTHPTIDAWQYSFFDQAAGFVEKVRYIEAMRKRLSPETRVNLNEIGAYAPGDFDPMARDTQIPNEFWNLSAGVFAYLYAELSKQGIDILAQSLIASGPGLAPGNSMIDWRTGKPNARFHVVKLLRDNFAEGDKLVHTSVEKSSNPDVFAQAFITQKGKKLLLINKRNYPVQVVLTMAGRVTAMTAVDGESGQDSPRYERLGSGDLCLHSFAVAIVLVEEG